MDGQASGVESQQLQKQQTSDEAGGISNPITIDLAPTNTYTTPTSCLVGVSSSKDEATMDASRLTEGPKADHVVPPGSHDTPLFGNPITDTEALRLLSTHQGLANTYQQMCSDRLREYKQVLDADYKLRIADFQLRSRLWQDRFLTKVRENFPKRATRKKMRLVEKDLKSLDVLLPRRDSFHLDIPHVEATWERPIPSTFNAHITAGSGVSSLKSRATTEKPALPHGQQQDETAKASPPPDKLDIQGWMCPDLESWQKSTVGVDNYLMTGVKHGKTTLILEPCVSGPIHRFVVRKTSASGKHSYFPLADIAKATKATYKKDIVFEDKSANVVLLWQLFCFLRVRKASLVEAWKNRHPNVTDIRLGSSEFVNNPLELVMSRLVAQHERRFSYMTVLSVSGTGGNSLRVPISFDEGAETMRRLVVVRAGEVRDIRTGSLVQQKATDVRIYEKEAYISMLTAFFNNFTWAQLAELIHDLREQYFPDLPPLQLPESAGPSNEPNSASDNDHRLNVKPPSDSGELHNPASPKNLRDNASQLSVELLSDNEELQDPASPKSLSGLEDFEQVDNESGQEAEAQGAEVPGGQGPSTTVPRKPIENPLENGGGYPIQKSKRPSSSNPEEAQHTKHSGSNAAPLKRNYSTDADEPLAHVAKRAKGNNTEDPVSADTRGSNNKTLPVIRLVLDDHKGGDDETIHWVMRPKRKGVVVSRTRSGFAFRDETRDPDDVLLPNIRVTRTEYVLEH